MSKKNMSDIIESYLKEFLKHSEQLEIKRSDIAERFDCVPSQINYVINTRFTQEHGYKVVSKRGGGGYIRIVKIELVEQVDHIDQMITLIGDRINQRNAEIMIETLLNQQIISNREARLMTMMVQKNLLSPIHNDEQKVRAYFLKNMLNQLRIHCN